MAADKARRTGPALEQAYQFVLWLVPTVEKFPRSQKFLLGDRLQAAALDVIDGLVEATYSKARAEKLTLPAPRLDRLDSGPQRCRVGMRSHAVTQSPHDGFVAGA